MELNIYTRAGDLRATVSPDENSIQRKAVMGENTLNVTFTTWEAIPFDVNDYVDFEGERYTLPSVPRPRQTSTVEFEYTLQFQGIENELSKALCFLLVDGGMDSDFSLTDSPAAHLQLVVDNINRIKGTSMWRIGSVISADHEAITYDGIDCLTALNRMADTFETEWWIAGTTINLCKCEHGELVELGYAEDGTGIGGLMGMSRREEENEGFFTRLYAKGSTRNIDRSRYGSDHLHLPSPLRYLEKNTEYGIVEREVIFDNVYPRRTGTVTSVRSIERESENGTVTVYYISDKDLPFNPNEYEIAGLVKRVSFETGELSGYDFDVNYDASSGEFELINQYPDESTQIPGGVMVPKAGDTYILYNIRMPDEYYTLAEEELKETADTYLEKHSVDSAVYSGDSDPLILRERSLCLSLGQRVRLRNDTFFPTGYRDSRVIGLSRRVNDPYDLTVEISEYVSVGRIESIERKIDSFLPTLGKDGGLLNIIKSGDDTIPTDLNVFSALRSISMFLRKDKPDSTRYLLSLLGGAITDNLQSQAFAAGPFGTGYLLKRDPSTGKSYMEIDELYVRLKAYFDTLEIKHLSHVGGRIVLSPAAMECNRVEIVDANYEPLYDSEGSQIYDSLNDEVMVPVGGGEQAYRCYFKQTDGEKEIVNEFAVDDLVQCREFNVKTNISHNVQNQYYWRRVINVGEDYIDLSMDDCDTGSMEPKAGDTIVTIGNKTDVNRQHVVFLSSYDDDAPCIKLYSGINSYSMLNKEVTVISPNADKNVFTGKVVIKPGSTGFKDLLDAPDMDEIEREIQEAKGAAIGANQAISNVQQSVADLQGYVTGAFSDGIISEAEAKAIEKYINVVRNEQRSTTSTYNKLENNPYLEGSALVGLTNAKSALDSAITALINAINTAIADGRTTTEEKNDVDVKYSTFNTKCAEFYTAVSAANQSIQDKLKGYSDEAQKAADEANKAVSALTSDLNELDNTVSELDRYVDVSFDDGIITAIEAASIEKYINVVNNQKASAEATYNQLYNNEYLPAATKTLLSNTKSELFSVIDTLVNNINAAIRDDKTTAAEKSAVDYWFNSYNDKCEAFAQAVETANEAIQGNLLNLAAASSDQKIQEALNGVTQQFAAINASLQTVKGDVNDLDTYLDAATEDGIITQIEAVAIGKYTNTINQTKKVMDATYTSLYSNQYLLGTYKSALYSAKTSFNTAVTNLLSSINSAIADNKTTESEMNTVNTRFNTFNTAYASLATAIENANKSIQAQLRAQIEAGVAKDIETAVGKVPQEVKDDFAKKLGYDDYDELVYYAERGQTVVTGGHINTDLIETSLLITTQLIAEAIKTNTLNVNDKFKVFTDGSVDMNGSVTSEEGDNRSTLSNGFFRLMRKRTSAFYEILRIAANNDDAEIFMKSSSGGVRYLSITPSGLTFDYVDTLTGGRINLTLDPTVIGKGMTNAIIKKTSDGMLYVSDDGEDKYKFTINVSGEGTTSPSPGTSYVTSGKIIYLHAYPDDGYEFSRWSDGGAQTHQISVNRDNYSITAYFTKKDTTTKYTLTLNRNPSNGGTVSGGGTYNAGTSVRVSATPNSGWRFVRWSDGMGQSHNVTMNANKSLTAYFEKYTVTGDEIFLGTALTSRSYWTAFGNASISSVSGGVATLKFTGYTSSTYVMFNKGYLGSKLEQGHKYMLTMQIKSSMSNTPIVGGIGSIDSNGDKDFVSYDGIIFGDHNDGNIGTSYKTINLQFTADRRDSTSSDGFIILTMENCTLSIKSLSLKEI